jgi:poly(3-hydroxybutyrate) depolymerase
MLASSPSLEKYSSMRSLVVLMCLFLFGTSLTAQTRIDSSFSFQTDPEKKYSLFVPDGYDENTPHRLMMALHPFNPANWDAIAWCDTLVTFGTMTDLIIVCPDGDTDGAIDDPIDIAFTTALMDSMQVWYNIDLDKQYCMGFSWGGKSTYTYGLDNYEMFGGFMPIGAAINGTGEIDNVLSNAAGLPWYLIHGGSDSPNDRLLMPGVGHTINFANRDQILTDAFFWVDSANCGLLTQVEEQVKELKFNVFPSILSSGDQLHVTIDVPNSSAYEMTLFGMNGELVLSQKALFSEGRNQLDISTDSLSPGSYIFLIEGNGTNENTTIVIQ